MPGAALNGGESFSWGIYGGLSRDLNLCEFTLFIKLLELLVSSLTVQFIWLRVYRCSMWEKMVSRSKSIRPPALTAGIWKLDCNGVILEKLPNLSMLFQIIQMVK